MRKANSSFNLPSLSFKAGEEAVWDSGANTVLKYKLQFHITANEGSEERPEEEMVDGTG